MKKIISLLATALTLSACSTVPEYVDNVTKPNAAQPDSQVGSKFLGYKHNISNSKFAIGNIMTNDLLGDSDRVIGTLGVFSVHRTSGLALGIPNYDSPALLRPAIQSGDLHNAMAVKYFIDMGIPADQMSEPSAQATMVVKLEPGQNKEITVPVLAYYNTVVRRKIDGITVFESLASVRFNVDGDVVEESIFWPEIDASVVNQAKAMAGKHIAGQFGSPVEGYDSGEVMIHHSSQLHKDSFHAAALITFHPLSNNTKSINGLKDTHLDLLGKEILFDHPFPFINKNIPRLRQP